jgi:hypothetical protein
MVWDSKMATLAGREQGTELLSRSETLLLERLSRRESRDGVKYGMGVTLAWLWLTRSGHGALW